VDWVGLSVLVLRTVDGPSVDIEEVLAPVHQHFQHHKPIMLLPVGISHFSRARYVYYMEETMEEIRQLYAALPGFPGVKAIVWFDRLRYGSQWDTLSITREHEILRAYAQAVADVYFISAFPPTGTGSVQKKLRANNAGYYYNGLYYINIDTLNELNINYSGEVTERDSRLYAPATLLGVTFTVCRVSRTITF
jgi:hypothetical protein